MTVATMPASDHTVKRLLETPLSSNFEERLKDSMLIRSLGNACYKMKRYEEAHRLYSRALHHVDFGDDCQAYDLTDERKQQIIECVKATHLNLARCFFQLGNHRMAISQALHIPSMGHQKDTSSNTILHKAHLLSGKAYLHLEEYEKAEIELMRSKLLASNDNGDVQNLLILARAKKTQLMKESRKATQTELPGKWNESRTFTSFKEHYSRNRWSSLRRSRAVINNEKKRRLWKAHEGEHAADTSLEENDTIWGALKNSTSLLSIMFGSIAFMYIVKFFQ